MKNRVKELRDAKHLTQTGLALKVGSTQQTISKIEREIGVPKLDLALIMADFFNVTLEYLTRYGLGLALIEKSVNKYNGLLNFDIDEENFTLTVLLYS